MQLMYGEQDDVWEEGSRGLIRVVVRCGGWPGMVGDKLGGWSGIVSGHVCVDGQVYVDG